MLTLIAAFVFFSCSKPEEKPEEVPEPPAPVEKERVKTKCLDNSWHEDAMKGFDAAGEGPHTGIMKECYNLCIEVSKCRENEVVFGGWKVLSKSERTFEKEYSESGAECTCCYRVYEFEKQ